MVEAKQIVEIPITREQIQNVRQTAIELAALTKVIRDYKVSTGGASTVKGGQQGKFEDSSIFFEKIADDLMKGNPVEVKTFGILKPGETAYKLEYQTTQGVICDHDGILNQNALYDALYRVGTNPFKWTRQSDIPYFGHLLEKGNRVFLTPLDLLRD